MELSHKEINLPPLLCPGGFACWPNTEGTEREVSRDPVFYSRGARHRLVHVPDIKSFGGRASQLVKKKKLAAQTRPRKGRGHSDGTGASRRKGSNKSHSPVLDQE